MENMVDKFGAIIGLYGFWEAKKREDAGPEEQGNSTSGGVGERQKEDKRGEQAFNREDGNMFT